MVRNATLVINGCERPNRYPSISRGQREASLKDKNRFFEIARGSALECAAIHDILVPFEAIDLELNRVARPT